MRLAKSGTLRSAIQAQSAGTLDAEQRPALDLQRVGLGAEDGGDQIE
jgi:hypothetical protein